MISNRVLRSKLDPNREVGQAAQGNRIAEEAYNDFHGFIRRAREAVGRGILFDMHGQGSRHAEKLKRTDFVQ